MTRELLELVVPHPVQPLLRRLVATFARSCSRTPSPPGAAAALHLTGVGRRWRRWQVGSGRQAAAREGKTNMELLLWILAVILVIAGIVTLIRGAVL